MNTTHGFALPTALLIMVAVLALAVSTLFMTRTDLRTASNITTASIARHNADATMTVALHALDSHVLTTGRLPDTLNLADNLLSGVHGWPQDQPLPRITFDASQLEYDPDHLAGTATIHITGTGPNNGSYDTEAHVRLATSSTGAQTLHPVVAHGITAGGTAEINGSGTLVDAGMHGNRGYRLNMDPRQVLHECHTRRSDGTCQTYFQYHRDVTVPYTAQEGLSRYEVCGPNWLRDYCDDNRPVQVTSDPFAAGATLDGFDPSYTTARNAVLCSLGACNSRPAIADVHCDVTLGNNPSINQPRAAVNLGFIPGNTVCINGSVRLPSQIDLTGVNVIARDSISFNGSPTAIENTIMVSLTDEIRFNGNADFKNTRMFAGTELRFNGSFTYEGTITLAAKDDVRFNGSTENPDGTTRMAIISDGNISINGSGDLWAAFLAGGDISINGSATVYGGFVSKGDTKINGSLTLDSGVPFENPDLPSTAGDSSTILEVVTRR